MIWPHDRIRSALTTMGPMLQVGVGLGVFGVANYGFLAVVGRDLGPAGSAAVSVAWTMVNLLGIGLFQPLEQETARTISGAKRTTGGTELLQVVQRYGLLTTTSISLLLVFLARPVADLMFEGRTAIPILLAAALVMQALAYQTRGLMSGSGRFAGYGAQLLFDGLLRVGLALGLMATGWSTQEAYVAVLVVAPLGSVLLTLRFVGVDRLRISARGVLEARVRPIVVLVLASLSAQLLANIGPPMIAILAMPAEAAVAGAFVAAVTVARVPLFLFAAIQAVFLPQLVRLRADHDHQGFQRAHRSGLIVTIAIAVLGLAAVATFGDVILMAIYGPGFSISHQAFVLLALSGALLMVAQVYAQGLLAHRGEKAAAVAWLIGVAIAMVMAFAPLALDLRVALSLTCGGGASLIAAAVMFARMTQAWKSPSITSERSGAGP